MWIRVAVSLPAMLCVVACSKSPEPGAAPAPPTQAVEARPPAVPTKAMVEMSDPAIHAYIVKDIGDHLEANTWRWGYERPELRFQLRETKGQRVEVDYSVAGATFKTTGPMTAKFFVNNKPIGTMKIPKPGEYVFSKPVPAEWLKTDGLTTVAVEAKPFWTSANDGRHLTVILTKAGFVSAAGHS